MKKLEVIESIDISGGVGYYPGMNEGARVTGEVLFGFVVGLVGGLWNGILEDADYDKTSN